MLTDEQQEAVAHKEGQARTRITFWNNGKEAKDKARFAKAHHVKPIEYVLQIDKMMDDGKLTIRSNFDMNRPK